MKEKKVSPITEIKSRIKDFLIDINFCRRIVLHFVSFLTHPQNLVTLKAERGRETHGKTRGCREKKKRARQAEGERERKGV